MEYRSCFPSCVAAIGFPWCPNMPLVEDGIDFAIEMAGLETLDEVFLVQVIDDLAIDQIPEFLGFGKVVHGDDAGISAIIERLDDVGSDKACSARNDGMNDPYRTDSSRVGSRQPYPACRPRYRRPGWQPCTASSHDAPAAISIARVAMTVSPRRRHRRPRGLERPPDDLVIPVERHALSLRVTSSASSPKRRRSVWALVASSPHRPIALRPGAVPSGWSDDCRTAYFAYHRLWGRPGQVCQQPAPVGSFRQCG